MDAQGKPVVDAEGKPVYMTEWERLPEYFRNVLRTSPETNKKMQEEGIKKLEESTGLSGKRFDELPGQISQIQKKIAQLQRDIPEGSRIPGSASQRKQSDMRNQINKLSENLKNLQGEFSSYKDFGTQLQDLRKMDMKQLRLSPEEMATLGISSGEGLYNLGQDLIGNVEARREKLISKDELSRQLALSQLAGLDVSNKLQKDLTSLTSKVDDAVVKIKLTEVTNLLKELASVKTIKDNHILNLLRYHELIKELKKV
jgi:predicted RNase H-like nuclease (RuvC/YqgF family)